MQRIAEAQTVAMFVKPIEEDAVRVVKSLLDRVADLTAADRISIDVLHAKGLSIKNISDEMKISQDVIQIYLKDSNSVWAEIKKRDEEIERDAEKFGVARLKFHEELRQKLLNVDKEFNKNELAFLKINQENIIKSVQSYAARVQAEIPEIFNMMTGKGETKAWLEQVSAANIPPALLDTYTQAGDQARKAYLKAWSSFGNDLSRIIMQASTGVNVARQIGAMIGEAIGKEIIRRLAGRLAGSAFGALLGSVIPGLGTALGAFIGGVIGDSGGGRDSSYNYIPGAGSTITPLPIPGQGTSSQQPVVIHINAIDGASIRGVLPLIVKAVRGNDDGFRTEMQFGLGIT